MDSRTTYSSAITSFDEKRDYEARRNRKSRSHSASSSTSSTSSTSSYASFTDKENRYTFTLPSCYSPPSTFTQTTTTAYYSSKPLPPLPTTPSGLQVRFALQKPLPPLPLTLSEHIGSYITHDQPVSDYGRRRSRANSSEDGEAWWAQQRLQTTREWISEKATFGDEDVRSL